MAGCKYQGVLMRQLILSLALVALLSPLGAAKAWADGPCNRLETCAPDVEGIITGIRREDVTNLPKGPADQGNGVYQPAANAPRYEYGSTVACSNTALPGEAGAEVMC